MSDYFGPEQDRILNVRDRNIDNVIFQYKKPPLSSDWNFINQISNEKISALSKSILPSGWINIGEIFQDVLESSVPNGSVICSEQYSANSFKLISKENKNIAIVNGWPIIVTLNNNTITLNPPTGQYYDFVFLEVWRKLIGINDPIYPYGNVSLNPYEDNEISYNSIEISKRVQIQYRVRVVEVNIGILDVSKEIFDLIDIYPIGGRVSEASFYKYNRYGSLDAGLYVAGDGTDNSKTYLNTVDGYCYAIPMFIVYRRKIGTTPFISTKINESYVTKDKLENGFVPDRPDLKAADIIYSDDIIDLRHKVGPDSLVGVMEQTIAKLISGELSTTLKLGTGDNGTYTNICSGGRELLKIERLNSIPGDNIPDIGEGINSYSNILRRRAFCNAEIIHEHNIIEIPNTGAWAEGTFAISSKVDLSGGEIISVDGFYSPEQGIVTGVSSDGTNITIEDIGSNSIVGTNSKLYMEFTFKYYSSYSGFKDVPKEFIEINKDDEIIIPTRERNIYLRYNNIGELLNYNASSGEYGYPDDITPNDYVCYKGCDYTSISNIGCILVLHRKTNSSGEVLLNLIDGKYNNYYILGVRSVEINGINVSFTSERVVSSVPEYKMESYIVSVPAYPNTDVVISIYIGSRYLESSGDDYSSEESVKFFELSKQGKGITDTFELIEVIANETPVNSGRYIINTGDKPIIKLATMVVSSGGYLESFPIAYKYDVTDTHIVLSDSKVDNLRYPILNSSEYTESFLPTIMEVKGPAGLEKIRVPVFVHSYITINEGIYNFYYKTIPYQGILNTTNIEINGQVIQEGNAIITTSGSGSIRDYKYNQGSISVVNNSRIVNGINTQFTKYVKSGDYLRVSDSHRMYKIFSVLSDTSLVLEEIYTGDNLLEVDYEITRLDLCREVFSNVIDRLPISDLVDYSYYSDLLDDENSLILTNATNKIQDLLSKSNITISTNNTAKRGRNDITIQGFKISEKWPYLNYSKTNELIAGRKKGIYQFYLFLRSDDNNNDLNGKLYLMVIGSNNTDNKITPFGDNVVELYELIGRPIIKR